MQKEETCRICLRKDSKMIFCLDEDSEGVSLAETFQFISGIELFDGEIANQICSKCNDDLLFASSIKRRILESDQYLRNQIENESRSKIIEIDPITDLSAISLMTMKTPDNFDNFSSSSKVNEKVLQRKSIKRKHEKTGERKNKVPNELDYKCFICNLTFDRISAKNNHVKIDHKDERFCKICQVKSKTSRSLEVHIKFHYCDYSFMCEVCSKVFRYRNRLNSHMALHHEKAAEMTCDLCGLATKFKNNIKRHMKSVHMKLREFQCTQCTGHQYSTQEALNSHLYRYHDVSAPISCPDCKHGFTFDSELRAHKKHGFCSNNVNANFVRRGKTHYDHLRVVDHTGEHICKICNEAFPNKNKFSMHNYLKHKYSNKCEKCNISFTNYTSLIRHQKVKHDGHKPFKCEFCFKTFGQKVSLISHRNTHTGEKSFFCSYCPFRSGDHGTVSKHKKKVHPEVIGSTVKTASL